jgi:hypothetical protein
MSDEKQYLKDQEAKAKKDQKAAPKGQEASNTQKPQQKEEPKKVEEKKEVLPVSLLDIESPQDKFITIDDSVNVKGSVKGKGINIAINSVSADVKDGKFEKDFALEAPGKHLVAIRALDKEGVRDEAKRRILKLVTFADVPQAIWRDRPTAAAEVPRDFSLRLAVEAREPLAAGTVVFVELDARQLPVAAGSVGLGGLRIQALSTPAPVALPLQVIPLADRPGEPGPALVLWSLDAALAAGHRREFRLEAGGGAWATPGGPLSLEVSATGIAIGNGSYRFEFDPQKNAAPRQLTFLPAGRRVEVAAADGLNGKSARLGVPGEPIRVRLGSAASSAAALGCVLDVPGSLPLSPAFGVRFHLRQLFLAGSPVIESWMRIPAQTVPERLVSLQLQSHRFRRGDFSVAREEEGEDEGDDEEDAGGDLDDLEEEEYDLDEEDEDGDDA